MGKRAEGQRDLRNWAQIPPRPLPAVTRCSFLRSFLHATTIPRTPVGCQTPGWEKGKAPECGLRGPSSAKQTPDGNARGRGGLRGREPPDGLAPRGPAHPPPHPGGGEFGPRPHGNQRRSEGLAAGREDEAVTTSAGRAAGARRRAAGSPGRAVAPALLLPAPQTSRESAARCGAGNAPGVPASPPDPRPGPPGRACPRGAGDPERPAKARACGGLGGGARQVEGSRILGLSLQNPEQRFSLNPKVSVQ